MAPARPNLMTIVALADRVSRTDFAGTPDLNVVRPAAPLHLPIYPQLSRATGSENVKTHEDGGGI